MATEQNEITTNTAEQPSAAPALRPSGIGTAVTFDWGIAVQTAIMAPFLALGIKPGDNTAGFPLAARLGVALLFAAIALGGVAFGEALRRGSRPVWIIQMIINAGLFFLGVHDIPDTIQSLQVGRFGPLVHTVVLLIISPVIAWLLIRKPTRQWFATTTSAQARARHSGRWIVTIAVCALISGAAIAFGPLY